MAALTIEATPATAFAAAPGVTVSSLQRIGVGALTGFTGAAALSVASGVLVGFQATTGFSASANAGASSGASIGFSAVTGICGKANLTGASDSRGVSVCTIINEMMNLWGIECIKQAPKFALQRAMNDLNGALQTVWNRADERDYWTNETLTLTFAADATTQDLVDDIQNVVGPCKTADDKRLLIGTGTLEELENFRDLFLDGNVPDEPVAYYIERQNQAGDDPAKCTLHIYPGPSVETDLLLDVVKEAPRYSLSDLYLCPLVPIPHKYAETLLLPIVRYKAATFWLFANPETLDGINREYLQAMASLGLADPLPGNSGDNKPDRNERKGGQS